MKDAIVFMGVAGCGKSSIARLVAQVERCMFIEGDEFHSAASREKMSHGIALTDADRAEWLSLLADEIRKHPQGLVLTCSGLKKAYRDQLRHSAAHLKFVFLNIAKDQALRRVSARSAEHFFPGELVDSQFAILESPEGEEGVLTVDASEPPEALQRRVTDWLRAGDKE